MIAPGRWRADQRERLHPIRKACSEAATDCRGDLRTDQMEAFDAQLLREAHEVVDNRVNRPGVVGRHGRGRAEATHVGSHHAKMAGEMRHPAEPHGSVLRAAMEKKHGLRITPRIGGVMRDVVHLEAGGYPYCRHVKAPASTN